MYKQLLGRYLGGLLRVARTINLLMSMTYLQFSSNSFTSLNKSESVFDSSL